MAHPPPFRVGQNSGRPVRNARGYEPSRDTARLRKMMWMVAGLVLLYGVFSRPSAWTWLTELNSRHPARGSAGVGQDPTGRQSADRNEETGDDPLPPGVVRIRQASSAQDNPPADVSPPEAGPDATAQPPSAASPMTGSTDATEAGADLNRPAAAAQKKAAVAAGGNDRSVIRLPPELLAEIKDQSVGLRASESPALEAMIRQLQQIPPKVLNTAAKNDLSFAELDNDPERYRGELVQLSGQMRRLTEFPLTLTSGQKLPIWEGWMFTESGGPKHPYRLFVLEKPDQFPTGEEIRQQVRVTGYFFKRCGYLTAHGLSFAPMLIVQKIRWTPPTVLAPQGSWAAWPVAATLMLLAMLFGAVLWRLTLADQTARQAVLADARTAPAPRFEQLSDQQLPDAEEFLRQLQSRAQQPQPTESALEPERTAEAALDPQADRAVPLQPLETRSPFESESKQDPAAPGPG